MVDPNTAKRVGKQTGADLMIFGNVFMKPKKRDGKTIKEYSINIRMTNIQSAEEVMRTKQQTIIDLATHIEFIRLSHPSVALHATQQKEIDDAIAAINTKRQEVMVDMNLFIDDAQSVQSPIKYRKSSMPSKLEKIESVTCFNQIGSPKNEKNKLKKTLKKL